MITLFTDTDCDVTPEIANEYGYKLISMPYIINSETIFPYKDFDKFDGEKFYAMLKGGVLPTTCAINSEEYKQYFEPEFEKGNDILYVHFSKVMSGTFQAMNIAIEELKEKYPERKVYTIDTKGITIISLAIAKEVGKMFKEGKSIEEVLEWAETEVNHYAVYFFADDLKFFARSGRVSGFAGFMGNVIGLHPIIHMNEEGKMVSIDKAIGRKKAIAKIMDYVDKLQDDIVNHQIIVAKTDFDAGVDLIVKSLKEKYGENINIEIVTVNPTAGSHCGPGCTGVCFHSKSR